MRSLFLVLLGVRINIAGLLPQKFVPESANPSALLPLLCGILLFMIVKNGAVAVSWRISIFSLAREQARFARNLFENYLRVPYGVHVHRSQSMGQHDLYVITNQMFAQMVYPALQTFSETLVLVVLSGYLLVISPLGTLLLGGWLLITLFLFQKATANSSIIAGRMWRSGAARLLQLMQEAFSDFKSIKLFGREQFLADQFGHSALQNAKLLAEDRIRQLLPRFMLEPTLVIGVVLFYAILAAEHAGHVRILSELSLYAAASFRILPAAHRIFSQSQTGSFQRPDIEAVLSSLSEPVEVLPDRPAGALPPAFVETISMKDISLRYAVDRSATLQNVCLEIHRGDKIILTGATGSGKSSLLNILLGLLPPSSGHVLIDGEVVWPLERFRKSSVSFVPQEVFLLDSTIAANVVFGSLQDQSSTDRIWEVLQIVKLEELVRGLPDGLETDIGHNGILLSGGERQRLALARALYQQPSLLVLDEATSQIDIKTEAEILDNILKLDGHITILMITHRASNNERFSRRLRMKRGHLVEVESDRSADAARGG